MLVDIHQRKTKPERCVNRAILTFWRACSAFTLFLFIKMSLNHWNSFQLLHWVRFDSIKPQVSLLYKTDFFSKKWLLAGYAPPPPSLYLEWMKESTLLSKDRHLLLVFAHARVLLTYVTKQKFGFPGLCYLFPVSLTQLRPFPSYLAPLFQNESSWQLLIWKFVWTCMRNKIFIWMVLHED